ncbi:MAG: serine/threonine protein kinase [Deltaproteobacteria bacterium]|nr:serine/threonine protein kinase [Deltaproteobacteria bacterium]
MGQRVGPEEDERATVDIGPRAQDQLGISAPDRARRHGTDHGPGGDTEAGSPWPHEDTDATGVAEPEAGPVETIDVHALETHQLPMQGKAAAVGDSKLLTSATTTSPIEALRLAEIARTRIFLKIVFVTNIMGSIGAVTTDGVAIARQVVLTACVVTSLSAVWLLLLARDPATYTTRRIMPPVLLLALGAFGGSYYWGVASPNAALIAWGIYFFSLGNSLRITAAVYVFCATIHGLLCAGIMTGILTDHGLINMSSMRSIDQVGILVMIEFFYLITFVTARVSQYVTLQAMSKLEQAVRNLAQRDAMLAEARAELDRALKIGGPGRYTEQIVGSFRLGNLIGRGGMGEVYEALGVTDKRAAAVKLLHPTTLSDPSHVERFLREAETASRLDCPHVVRVLEVGTTPGQVPYLAMERLRGFDLSHQLRRQRKLGLQQARVFTDHVAIGLEAARVAGIVHRDLKPHNVFCAQQGPEPCWKILDFGVCTSGGSGTLTKGHIVGTPAYMAPEQARGETVDHRADVYALAAILYRAVTGHTAFTGKDVPSTLYEVVYRVPTQPSIHTELPSDVDRVLAIGLAKDAKHRFDTALELAQWFARAVDGGLAHEERRRAEGVISRYPWGTRACLARSK